MEGVHWEANALLLTLMHRKPKHMTKQKAGYPRLIEHFCFYLFSCSASLDEEKINTTHMLMWSAKAKHLVPIFWETQ